MIARIDSRILIWLVLKSLSMIVVYRIGKSGKVFEESVGFHLVNLVCIIKSNLRFVHQWVLY